MTEGFLGLAAQLALSIWLGSMVFFSFVAALALRTVLSHGPDARRGVAAILGAAMLALSLYGWRVLLPRLERARLGLEGRDPTDRADLETRHFRALHARSVRLNAAVLGLGLVSLVLHWVTG